MKRRECLAMAAALPVLAAPAWAAPARPGETVEWPEVTLLDGTRLGPAQLAGRAVVAVFWSVDCPFCRRHNPHIEQLHRAAAGRALTVLGIAREPDAALVRRHAQQRGYSFPITTDHAPLAAALSTRRIVPLTVTVDRAGRLRHVIPGEMFEADVMELLALAGGGASAPGRT